MNVERLEQLQKTVDAGEALRPDDIAALLAEIWRLRTSLSAKSIEADYWRTSTEESKHDLDNATAALRALRLEFDEHKAQHGLVKCDLENRWSNCAVRMRKRARKT
jgi:hypothetical protein